ncbi:MAG: S8 family serine peptidase, partial [Gemmataceae bacterium]
GYRTGTSMATPFVSGVVALVWATHPTWTYSQVIAQVLKTATPVASLSGKVATGGVVNAAVAVGAASSSSVEPVSPATAPKAVSAVSGGPTVTTLSSVRVTFDRAMTFSSLLAANVRLTTPAGAVVSATNVKDVGGSGGKAFDLIFPLQSAPGAYALRVTAARDAGGVVMEAFTTAITRAAAAPVVNTAPKAVSAVAGGPTAVTLSSARVTFDRAMTFSSLTAASVTLTTPDGRTVTAANVKDVGGSGGKGFDLIFPLQMARGTYTLRIAAVALDLNGVVMEAYTVALTR